MDAPFNGCRLRAFARELVERTDVRLGRRNQRVWIGPLRSERTTVLREADRYFRLRVSATGDGMHLVKLKRCLVRYQCAYCLEDRVDRAIAGRLRGDMLTVDVERERGGLRAHGAGDDCQR